MTDAEEKKFHIEVYRGKQFSLRKFEENKWMWHVHGIRATPSFCNSKEEAIAQAKVYIDKTTGK